MLQSGHKTASQMLASPESFAAIGDVDKRSAAVFTELGKVLTKSALRELPSGRREIRRRLPGPLISSVVT
jgi:hypothetical protein